jgi:preprotein translocase subunit SecG
MSWIIGILTFILVINCVLMILLILVQLPKKEAGLGTAFGSGATDALFGAGTGNALTKLTKYCAGIFFVLTLSLSILNAHQSKAKQDKLQSAIQEVSAEEEASQPAAPAENPAAPAPATNLLNTITTTLPEATTTTETPAPVPAPAPAPNNPN